MKVENFLGALSPECQTGSRRSLYFESWREGGGEGEGAVSGYKQRTVHTTHHSVCLHIHFLHPCCSTFKTQTKLCRNIQQTKVVLCERGWRGGGWLSHCQVRPASRIQTKNCTVCTTTITTLHPTLTLSRTRQICTDGTCTLHPSNLA